MKKISVAAAREKLDEVLDFIAEEIGSYECERKAVLQINMAVEEIFLNVSSYAYGEGTGDVEISLDVDDNGMLTMIFADSGIPFDPLKKQDTDVHIPGRERKPGGLGIMMVKKTMDEISYEYLDNKNTLIIKKSLR